MDMETADTVKTSIWATVVLLAIVAISFAGSKGCQESAQTMRTCIEKTSRPLECRAAMEGR